MIHSPCDSRSLRTGPFAAVAAALLLALVVAQGCRSDDARSVADAGPRAGGVLAVGSVADVDTWNEYVSRQAFALNILRRIYLPLAVELPGAPGTQAVFEPRLAESWEFSEDRRLLRFRLREARWSDGAPVTADDVVFTWQAQTDEAVPWVDAGRKQRIRQVVALEPRTVEFEFDGAYAAQFADAVEGGIVPRHVFSRVPFADWTTHDWAAAVVGSGPFVLERHDPGTEIVLAPNPEYFGPAPYVERLVVRVIPDISNLLTQVRSGSLDFVAGVPPRDAAGLASAGLQVVAFDSPSYTYLGWNGSRPPFDDPEVRRAMTLAIDREAIVDGLLFGFGKVSRGPVLSFWPAADTTLEPWPYDPDAARKLLEGKGLCEVGGACRLSVKILTGHGNELREAVVVKVQENLARIGVQSTLESMETQAMRQQIARGDFAAYVGSWIYTVDDLSSVFHSGARFPQGANLVGYASPEADRLLDAAREAATADDLREPIAAFQQTVHRDQPYTFLYEQRQIAVWGPRVAGVEIRHPSDPFAALESAWLR